MKIQAYIYFVQTVTSRMFENIKKMCVVNYLLLFVHWAFVDVTVFFLTQENVKKEEEKMCLVV